MKISDHTITTEEGITFEHWTDGWAIGFLATAPDGRTEVVALNPSGGGFDALDATSLGDVFVYHGAVESGAAEAGRDLIGDGNLLPVCYVNIFEKERA